MHFTEKLALNWLSAKFQLDPKVIIYGGTISPDFILPDGTGYEVKTIYHQNKLYFSERQIKELKEYDKCYVLAYSFKPYPVTIIDMKDIDNCEYIICVKPSCNYNTATLSKEMHQHFAKLCIGKPNYWDEYKRQVKEYLSKVGHGE